MILAVAATEIEMTPFLTQAESLQNCLSFVSGVGPVETAVRLTSFLNNHYSEKDIKAVVNFGVAGAYPRCEKRQQADLLDCCLAESEILGDLGICFDDHLQALPVELGVKNCFYLDKDLLKRGEKILNKENWTVHTGCFITVSCTSGTAKRAAILQKSYRGLCENMEGAAVARVCEQFSLPLLEIRCISNMVEDRNVSRWKLQEASVKAAQAAFLIVGELNLLT